MTRRLPPLHALRAFEVAARLQSFQEAARELRVTPAAVSQQVKTLESGVGAKLFRRFHRGVEVTPCGKAYYEKIAPALDAVASATDELTQEEHSRVVRISALPVFAEKWLVPRLHRFRRAHPDIELFLSTDAPVVDFRNADFDIGLRCTDGNHPGIIVRELFRDQLFPVCHPELAKKLRTPADLAHQTLLYDQHWRDDWRRWLEAVGYPEFEHFEGSAFGLYSMAVAAAVDGLGVLIAHDTLVAREIASGALVRPFSEEVEARYAHYVVWPPWVERHPAVRAFISWILAEAAEDRKSALHPKCAQSM
jgi:LysR family glycine cleavage system transcriptional activator